VPSHDHPAHRPSHPSRPNARRPPRTTPQRRRGIRHRGLSSLGSSMGDHLEPFGGRVDLVLRPSYRRLHVHIRDILIRPISCRLTPLWQHQVLTVRIDPAETTSLSSPPAARTIGVA
jgi:hypothetical protein